MRKRVGAGNSLIERLERALIAAQHQPSQLETVEDAKPRVNGVKGLRIADSSIVPLAASVAAMSTGLLIGERMAEVLQQKT